MRVGALVLLGVLAVAGCAGASGEVSDGPRMAAAHRAQLLFFVLHDCPISNAYAPEVARIALDYAGKGVNTRVVYVDEGVPDTVLREHAREYAYPCPIVIDTSRELARRYEVAVVPAAVVLGGDGQMKYSGRIDDLYAELGRKRMAPTVRDLRNALDAVVEGRPVANPRVPGVGCTIEF